MSINISRLTTLKHSIENFSIACQLGFPRAGSQNVEVYRIEYTTTTYSYFNL